MHSSTSSEGPRLVRISAICTNKGGHRISNRVVFSNEWHEAPRVSRVQ